MKTNAKIYVMQAEDGTIKLGHSRDPAKRATQIGRPVLVVHETDVIEQVERIERLAHRVLALHGKHLRGEWFEATLGDALRAIEIATRQAEHQELALGGKIEIGRPVGTGNDLDLIVHVRLPGDLREGLEAIRDRIAEDDEKPSMSAMIRKAIREYIRSQGGA